MRPSGRKWIVARAAPSPEHGVILGSLARELGNRLRGHRECRLEVGRGAVPQYKQRDTARIPDAMMRCGQHPRVVFEVVSPSELRHQRQWGQKRADLQAGELGLEIYPAFRRHRCILPGDGFPLPHSD